MATEKPSEKAMRESEPSTDMEVAWNELSFVELQRQIIASVNESVEDPAVIEERIFRQMMEATTPEEILGAGAVTSWRDNLDTPVLVHGVRFNRSDFGGGEQLYAIVDGTLRGKRVTLSCGARTPMQQLLVFQHKDLLPYRMMLTQSPRPTADGFYPLSLIPASADTQEEPF